MISFVAGNCAVFIMREWNSKPYKVHESHNRSLCLAKGNVAMHAFSVEKIQSHISDRIRLVATNRKLVIGLLIRTGII